ncbi:hypothetical protein TNCV_5134151 [Trichonephila clavipes]|nr:hypothetical protein TNCV_5134151 [Trichonephila clavipes]
MYLSEPDPVIRSLFLRERNLEEMDIEDYLDQLEGDWFSEEGLNDANSDKKYHDADEIRIIAILTVFNCHQE